MTAPAEQIRGAVGEGAGRRPALDGLRAVAVGLVVAFHCSVDALEGGFVGVDVFFVLSGYLVTGVLLRDREAHGRTRFAHFYARRVRRLLPASVVTLLVTLAAFTVLVSAIELDPIVRATRAALLYVANWFFIGESTDYFADDVARNPVLHMWSLAVEEQFYLLWPLLLTGLLVLGRRLGRERRVAAIAVAAGGLVSLGAALALRTSSPSQAYFGTGTRAYQLLAGALLALVPVVIARARRRPGPVAAGALVALALTCLVATSLVDVDPIVRGVLTTVTTLVVIVGLEAAPDGLLGRALSLDPIVYLGQISYGTYLWHWPVVVALDELVDVSTPSRVVLVSVLACALAALSHRLLEAPIRTSRRLDRLPGATVAVTGVALSVVAALVLVPRIGEGGGTSPPPASEVAVTAGLTPIPDDLDVVAVKDAGYGVAAKCEGRPVEECTMVEGEGVHLLLMGDSNAEMMVPAFVALARQEGITFSTALNSGCPWQLGFYTLQGEFRSDCDRIREDAYDRVIPALDPDVIVTIDAMPGIGFSSEPVAERSGELQDATAASIERLSDGGRRRVVLLQPIPGPAWASDFDPLPCLAEARYSEECRFTDVTRDSWYRGLLDDLAADPDDQVTSLDIGRLVCPLAPVCDPIVDGQVVFWNERHVTASWSESMGPPLATAFRAEGLLDPP